MALRFVQIRHNGLVAAARFAAWTACFLFAMLSDRTRGLVGKQELALMKPSALLVNTSRSPIVIETDLLHALENNTIAGAAIDAFDQEPLAPDHPFRRSPKLLATPHIGFVSRGLYKRFYEDTVKNIAQWLESQGL
jgi:phosphoglycerate dehydrogenase-like enzyme